MKNIPMRMCVCCRQMQPKNTLARIVKNNENQVFVDLDGKANGRGAYLCKTSVCIAKAKKSKVLNRQLETNVDDSIFQQLESLISK